MPLLGRIIFCTSEGIFGPNCQNIPFRFNNDIIILATSHTYMFRGITNVFWLVLWGIISTMNTISYDKTALHNNNIIHHTSSVINIFTRYSHAAKMAIHYQKRCSMNLKNKLIGSHVFISPNFCRYFCLYSDTYILVIYYVHLFCLSYY